MDAPQEQIKISWEDNVMRIRDQAKLSVSHFEEELFTVLDPFFKLTNQINKQITIIMKENERLIKILPARSRGSVPGRPRCALDGQSRRSGGAVAGRHPGRALGDPDQLAPRARRGGVCGRGLWRARHLRRPSLC